MKSFGLCGQIVQGSNQEEKHTASFFTPLGLGNKQTNKKYTKGSEATIKPRVGAEDRMPGNSGEGLF